MIPVKLHEGKLVDKVGLLKKKLIKIEKELNKCRTSTIEDGWQTQRYAKKARKWDYYAQEKMKIIQQIEEYENNNINAS